MNAGAFSALRFRVPDPVLRVAVRRPGSSAVPFEQIGQSAVKRLWRQKTDKGF